MGQVWVWGGDGGSTGDFQTVRPPKPPVSPSRPFCPLPTLTWFRSTSHWPPLNRCRVLCPLLPPWSHALVLLLLLLVEASAAACPLTAQAAGPKAAAHRLPAAARPASAPPCPLRAAAFNRVRSILAAAAAAAGLQPPDQRYAASRWL